MACEDGDLFCAAGGVPDLEGAVAVRHDPSAVRAHRTAPYHVGSAAEGADESVGLPQPRIPVYPRPGTREAAPFPLVDQTFGE